MAHRSLSTSAFRLNRWFLGPLIMAPGAAKPKPQLVKRKSFEEKAAETQARLEARLGTVLLQLRGSVRVRVR